MPKFVATTVTTTINGVDFSANLAQVELSIESDDVETTAFGSDWRTRVGGLKQHRRDLPRLAGVMRGRDQPHSLD